MNNSSAEPCQECREFFKSKSEFDNTFFDVFGWTLTLEGWEKHLRCLAESVSLSHGKKEAERFYITADTLDEILRTWKRAYGERG